MSGNNSQEIARQLNEVYYALNTSFKGIPTSPGFEAYEFVVPLTAHQMSLPVRMYIPCEYPIKPPSLICSAVHPCINEKSSFTHSYLAQWNEKKKLVTLIKIMIDEFTKIKPEVAGAPSQPPKQYSEVEIEVIGALQQMNREELKSLSSNDTRIEELYYSLKCVQNNLKKEYAKLEEYERKAKANIEKHKELEQISETARSNLQTYLTHSVIIEKEKETVVQSSKGRTIEDLVSILEQQYQKSESLADSAKKQLKNGEIKEGELKEFVQKYTHARIQAHLMEYYIDNIKKGKVNYTDIQ